MNTNAPNRRPGRPPGSSDTRQRILDSAREMFARNGIHNTSVRAVAAAAGVDAALVHHYYGTKQQLFAAAVRIPINPMDVIAEFRDVPVEQLGHRMASTLLTLWDSELGAAIVAAVRSMITGGDVNLFRTFLRDIIAVEVGTRVDDPPGSGLIRIEFVAAQLVGVLMARYVLQLDPFASLPAEQIAATIAPNLQHYFTGDLPVAPAP